MNLTGFDLAASAHQTMLDEGFQPDFPRAVDQQLAALRTRPVTAAGNGVRDLRPMLWSSIDNDTSRDLDQAEVAERIDGGASGIRLLIAIADVDSDVPPGTPIAMDRTFRRDKTAHCSVARAAAGS